MGYEFEWAVLPEPAASARRRFETCQDIGLPCLHTPMCAETYFSLAGQYRFWLNIAGMAVCRDGMRLAGMTYEAPAPAFPPWSFKNVEEWQAADQSERDAFNVAEAAASAATVPGMNGIPEFKFLSNGPWLVGVTEIGQALTIYGNANPSLCTELESDGLWRDWLAWLRETQHHSGFTVT